MPQEFVEGQQQLEVTYYIKTYTALPGATFANYAEAEAAWEKSDDITRTVNLTAIHPADKQSWNMNQKITYTLKFSTTEIRWAPMVTDWTATDYTIDF